MHDLQESFIIAALLLVIFLIVVLAVGNLYLIRRNGFYVNVNCWFCNTWSKIPFSNRNSFDCPVCLQYNGFDKDGDYNKIIEAQHDTSKTLTKTTIKTEQFSNGLCTYCNNNQRLKIRQLADFTPMNEKNYEVEIEHFRQQLEKSYKLCKRCGTVLKNTLNRQYSWIFGTNLKNLKNKGINKLVQATKYYRKSASMTFIRYVLIALTFIVFCEILDIRIDYPLVKNIQKVIPLNLQTYSIVFNEYYARLINTTAEFTQDKFTQNLKFENNVLGVISSLGVLLQLILLAAEKNINWWKFNEMLGWMLLFTSSMVSFDNDFFSEIEILQIFASLALLYSYVTSKSVVNQLSTTWNKKYEFKKLRSSKDSSEEDEDIFPDSEKRTASPLHCQYFRASSPVSQSSFHNQVKSSDFKKSCTTASTTSLFNKPRNTSLYNDLNSSLDNLHLTKDCLKPRPCTSPVFSVNSSRRPLVSPPKLKNITQNSWTAGGFWKNDLNSSFTGVPDGSQHSRSSSQTSGFISQQGFQSLPPSREESLCSDVEHHSIVSEPTYHQSPFSTNSGTKIGQQLYYRSDNNTFYPVLSSNSMLVLQSIPQYGFSHFSMNNYPQHNGGISSPMFFTKSPNSFLK